MAEIKNVLFHYGGGIVLFDLVGLVWFWLVFFLVFLFHNFTELAKSCFIKGMSVEGPDIESFSHFFRHIQIKKWSIKLLCFHIIRVMLMFLEGG